MTNQVEEFPVFTADCHSLVKHYLTRELYQHLKEINTVNGFTLARAIRSGVLNQDSHIGLYAGDADSYQLFSSLFEPIIEAYHQVRIADLACRPFVRQPPTWGNPDPAGRHVLSTRIRVARNLAGWPLGACLSPMQRQQIETVVVTILEGFTGDLAGTYHPLTTMDEKEQADLINRHLLFKSGDRFLQAAGITRDWPRNRGIFFNQNKSFLAWINEEDQLRIISMQAGADFRAVYTRLAEALAVLEKELEFLFDERLGYLTSCPTNLGTAMRASVHIRLPRLAARAGRLDQLAKELELQIRGVHGEHTTSPEGVFDISNKRRLGFTEGELLMTLERGISVLIQEEEGQSGQ